MPKIKTNKQAAKKVRVSASGRIKRAQAYTSHNTAKKTPKRRRQLRGTVAVDDANKSALARMLPYNGVK
jgi:large subunit ribosomal protein L35